MCIPWIKSSNICTLIYTKCTQEKLYFNNIYYKNRHNKSLYVHYILHLDYLQANSKNHYTLIH